MSEAEWLTSSDPEPMLEYARGKVGDRKFRLFQVACCRRIWELLPDDACRDAVLVAERYADGGAGDRERQATQARIAAGPDSAPPLHDNARDAAVHANEEIVGRAVVFMGTAMVLAESARTEGKVSNVDLCPIVYAAEQAVEADLVRDIFGNPFRPVTADPAWLTSTVLQLAQGIHDDRAFDRLPILADALQDAGCDNDDVLAHCRGPGPHVRGCWVVDLLLGKG